MGRDKSISLVRAVNAEGGILGAVLQRESEVEDPSEKAAALRALCQKLTPGHMEGFEAAMEKSLSATAVWKVRMETLSSKAKL